MRKRLSIQLNGSMRAVLRRLGVGDIFLKLVSVLYNSPLARVRTGNMVSSPIHITRGTRQGCPLSPLLYAIAAEPLISAIREYHGHRGLRFPDYNLIVSAYTDDMLLYIRDPATNLSPIIREVIRFGGLSGLTINWDKSLIHPLTPATIQTLLDFPLQWTTDPIRYLGIQIYADADQVIRANYGRAITKLSDDIDRWIRLLLSLVGSH